MLFSPLPPVNTRELRFHPLHSLAPPLHLTFPPPFSHRSAPTSYPLHHVPMGSPTGISLVPLPASPCSPILCTPGQHQWIALLDSCAQVHGMSRRKPSTPKWTWLPRWQRRISPRLSGCVRPGMGAVLCCLRRGRHVRPLPRDRNGVVYSQGSLLFWRPSV
jgi:hypothetical protein